MSSENRSFPCSEVPDPRRVIVRCRDDMLPVGTVHGAARELHEYSDGSRIGLGFPDTRGLVEGSSDYLPTIGAKCSPPDDCSMAAENRDRTASFRVPNPRRLVYGCGDPPAAIGTENSTVHKSGMPAEDHDRITCAHRPDPGRVIVRCRDHTLAVRAECRHKHILSMSL